MNFIRNATSWLSFYLVGVCYFLAANAFVVTMVLNADTIKQTLDEQGTYSKVVPSVLSTAKYTGPSVGGTLPLDEPWVKDIVNKSFTPQDIEKQSDTLVNGIFAWLDGKTNNPEFTIDLTENKQRLADETGAYVTNRLAGLPACTRSNLPTSVDPYRVNCLPPGVSPSLVGSTVSNDIFTNETFLKNPVIKAGGDQAADSPQVNADALRTAYQQKSLGTWLFPALAVLFAIIGFAASTSRRRALGALSHSLVLTAFGLAGIAIFLTFGTQFIIATAARDAITKDILGPIILDLAGQARTIYIIFAAVALVVSAILYIVKRKITHLKTN